MKKIGYIARGLFGIFTVALLAVFPVGGQEFREFPPDIEWQQIETEHFLILFDEAYRASAEKVVEMVEPMHQQVTEFLDYSPKNKTTVILTDHVDFFNGYATPLPNNRIVVYLREPGAGTPLFGLHSPDWLAMLLTHEYTHIVHLDMVDGFNAAARTLFGRIILPNAALSGWMIEGLGVYAETKFHDGRGRHSAFDMYMRADVLDENLKRLELAVVGGRQWPGGALYYLYGYFFLQYLADTYGEETIVELNQYNSRRLPLQKNIFKKVYDDKKLDTLWEEWQAAVQDRYTQQIAAIQADPVTRTTPVSSGGTGTNSPVFSPDGQFVYYFDASAHDTTALVQYRLSDGRLTRLTEDAFSGNISLSPDGQTVYFCQYQNFQTFSVYSDVYALDVATRRVRRLSRGLRAFDPAASPDGKTLVFTTTQAGSMSLMQMNLETKELTPLWETGDQTQIGRPAFSSDGSKLAAHVWVEGGFQDIYVMNSDGSNRRALTFDKATDSAPVWSADDAYLFFNSDRTGVPNIFAYQLETDTLYQVTNVLTGAFHPSISPDDKRLALELYSSAGLDIHLTDIDRDTWRVTPFEREELPELPPYQVAETGSRHEAKPYSPFPSVLPTSWLPYYGQDEAGYQLGILLQGNDVLHDHSYSLSALYGLESKRVGLFGRYTNQQFYPTITVYGSDNAKEFGNIFTDDDGDEKTYWQRDQSTGIMISMPIYQTLQSSLMLATGYRYKKMQALTEVAALTPQPDEGALSGVSVGLEFSQHLTASNYAIAPESGLIASVMYRRDDKELGSDFTLDTVVAETRAYLEIPKLRHHVLAVRMLGGASDGDTLSQGIFQVGGNGLDSELTSLEQQRYVLRGYKSGAFSGNRFALGSAEYRVPLWYPQRGFGDGFVFFDSIVAAAFYDVGYAWDGDMKVDDFKHGIGGDIRINVGLLRGRWPLTLRAGYAHGLDEADGTSQFTYGLNFEVWL